jgi:motility quorum-sensing regulator/GCU-specific mRNA interferase toxin
VSLGCFDRGGIANVIQTIERHMFYKSMTTHADHRVWQDVYHVPTNDGPTLYVKFQANVVTDFTVVSFKEKQPWRQRQQLSRRRCRLPRQARG